MDKSLEKKILERINKEGPISFAEYMNEALYAPAQGYYMGSSQGFGGIDYITSPDTHPAFGALLAEYVCSLWRGMDMPPFTIAEIGAGQGLLAADFVKYAESTLPCFSDKLTYRAFDVEGGGRVHWEVEPIENFPTIQYGCIIGNELLDAFPVHLFEIHNGEPLEVFMTTQDGALSEILCEPSSEVIKERLKDTLRDLPDGYRGEVCAEPLEHWANEVSSHLQSGLVILIDYFLPRSKLYSPQRKRGTIRSFKSHTLGTLLTEEPSNQDITASVDITAVDELLTGLGFDNVIKISQDDFLSACGAREWLDFVNGSGLVERERLANGAGIRKLLDPTVFGGFTVVVYSRNCTPPKLPINCNARPPLIRDYPGHIDLWKYWNRFARYL